MKNFKTIEELIDSKKGQELVESLRDCEIEGVKGLLDLRYWTRKTENEKTFYVWTLEDLENAINDLDNCAYFEDYDAYYDFCDETLEFPRWNDLLERYFDYDAFHRDCDFDVSEAYNWVVFLDY